MKKVSFPCGHIMLEGAISFPQGPGPFPLVVVCHPHPLYGGSMHNNVVYAVCGRLEEKGLAWLKFNFRGVGNSGGEFADGIGEKEDARAALSFAGQQKETDPERMGLCGYSFGSMVALAVAAEDPRVKAVAAVSPLMTTPDFLKGCFIPKLFLSGTHDEFIDSKKLERLVMNLPDPKELVVYSGGDHFWNRYEEPMAEKVAEFFKRIFNAAA